MCAHTRDDVVHACVYRYASGRWQAHTHGVRGREGMPVHTDKVQDDRGVAGEGGGSRQPRAADSNGCQNEYFKRNKYSKTCLKRNAIVPVFFSVFTGFRFTKGCVLIKQSTKNMIA